MPTPGGAQEEGFTEWKESVERQLVDLASTALAISFKTDTRIWGAPFDPLKHKMCIHSDSVVTNTDGNGDIPVLNLVSAVAGANSIVAISGDTTGSWVSSIRVADNNVAYARMNYIAGSGPIISTGPHRVNYVLVGWKNK